jgi:hypothetical protein
VMVVLLAFVLFNESSNALFSKIFPSAFAKVYKYQQKYQYARKIISIKIS